MATLEDEALQPDQFDELARASTPVVARRLEGLGLVVHAITQEQGGRLKIDLSGEMDNEAIVSAISTRGAIRIMLVDLAALPADLQNGIAPPGSRIVEMADGSGPIAVRQLGGIHSEDIIDVRPVIDPQTGAPSVSIGFSEAGTAALARMTSANIGRPLAIVLDDEVLSAPIVQEAVTEGQLQLSGGFTPEQAETLAIILMTAELPIAFELVEQTTFN